MTPVAPPQWSTDDFAVASLHSTGLFREQRLREPLDQYLEAFDLCRGWIEDLLEATVDLRNLEPVVQDVLGDPALQEAIRYLPGPPISKDDLKVVAEASLTRSVLEKDPEMARRVIETVMIGLDRRRFAWVPENREPEEAERDAAILATAALMATQRLATNRRSEGKNAQEEAVEAALIEGGLTQVPTRNINSMSSAPQDGEFCRESHFGERKADFVIGLWDGRKMPLECKVSNSSTNSVKRLNNDAAVKAVVWVQQFGTVQTVPAAMLAGVFKVRNLESAQDRGLSIFWEFDLDVFTNWIDSTRI